MENETIIEEHFAGNNFLIKSKVGKENNKVFVSYMCPMLTTLRIFMFDFDSFQSSGIRWSITCIQGTNLINIDYFECIDKFIYSCKDDNAI